jgi:hypothetical protein
MIKVHVVTQVQLEQKLNEINDNGDKIITIIMSSPENILIIVDEKK